MTETQIARVLAGTPLQVEMTLFAPTGYVPKNTPREHMIDFYRPWEEIREEKLDGLIVTGAPVAQMPFEEVVYWDQLRRVFARSDERSVWQGWVSKFSCRWGPIT